MERSTVLFIQFVCIVLGATAVMSGPTPGCRLSKSECTGSCALDVSTSIKAGWCPAVVGAGQCVEQCTSDFNCTGTQKCCSNGCGHTCQQPVTTSCLPKLGAAVNTTTGQRVAVGCMCRVPPASCSLPDAVFSFDECSGRTVHSQTTAHTLHYESSSPTTPFGPGFARAGLHFDGRSVLVAPSAADFSFAANSPFTISLWVARRTGGGSVLVAKLGGDRGYVLSFTRAGLLVLAIVGDGGLSVGAMRATTTNPFLGLASSITSPSDWMHIQVSYDGSMVASGVQFHVNGAPVPRTPNLRALTGTTQTLAPLSVGGIAGAPSTWQYSRLEGAIDQLVISCRATTTAPFPSVLAATPAFGPEDCACFVAGLPQCCARPLSTNVTRCANGTVAPECCALTGEYRCPDSTGLSTCPLQLVGHPCPCASDDDCQFDDVTVGGESTCVQKRCGTDGRCFASPLVCPRCSVCSVGGGACQPNGTGSCTIDSDCAANEICLESVPDSCSFECVPRLPLVGAVNFFALFGGRAWNVTTGSPIQSILCDERVGIHLSPAPDRLGFVFNATFATTLHNGSSSGVRVSPTHQEGDNHFDAGHYDHRARFGKLGPLPGTGTFQREARLPPKSSGVRRYVLCNGTKPSACPPPVYSVPTSVAAGPSSTWILYDVRAQTASSPFVGQLSSDVEFVLDQVHAESGVLLRRYISFPDPYNGSAPGPPPLDSVSGPVSSPVCSNPITIPADGSEAFTADLTIANMTVIVVDVRLGLLHPRVYMGRRMSGHTHHATEMGGPLNPLNATTPEQQHFDSQRLEDRVLPFASIPRRELYFRVRATPRSPAPSPTASRLTNYRIQYRGSPPEIVSSVDDVFPGYMLANGSFAVAVPPNPAGYTVIVDAGKLKVRRDFGPIGPCINSATTAKTSLNGNPCIVYGEITIESTLQSVCRPYYPESVGDGDLTFPPSAVATIEAALTNHSNRFIFDQQCATAIVGGAGAGGGAGGSSPGRRRLAAANCDSTSADYDASICYLAGDAEIFNLMSASEITTYAASHRTITFDSFPGTTLRRRSYADGSNGVLLYRGGIRTLSTGVVVPLPLVVPWSFGVRVRSTKLEEDARGFATITPPTTSSTGGSVMFRFESANVRSAGLTIQNGAEHSATPTEVKRRGFRLTIYDATGAELHHYNWYTVQTGGPQFYGIASNTAFTYLQVSTGSTDPFTIDSLTYTDDYVPSAVVADAAGSTLTDNLGWRADGNWAKTSIAATAGFRHPYYGTATFRMGTPNTGGTYWGCPYGAAAAATGSTLVGPAFTLSNLVAWSNKDTDTNKWLLGLNIDAAKDIGYGSLGDTEVSQRRIPTTSCPTMCAASVVMSDYFADTSFHMHESSAVMHSHWSHVHWGAFIDVESGAQYSNIIGSTERYVEYSTDNGATWRNAYWFEDENHHGRNNVWWMNHMHPFADSDLSNSDVRFANDFNGDPATTGTDFDKDGVDDYVSTNDNNYDGVVDTSDVREWDTEFYMDYEAVTTALPVSSTSTDIYGNVFNFVTSDMEGVSVIYRFRFYGPNAASTYSGCSAGCLGWMIDDVAFNNDDINVGYYTNFDGAYDSSYN